jgi:hypothetical protein
VHFQVESETFEVAVQLEHSCETFEYIFHFISSTRRSVFALNTSAKEKIWSLGRVIFTQVSIGFLVEHARKGLGRSLAVRLFSLPLPIIYADFGDGNS